MATEQTELFDVPTAPPAPPAHGTPGERRRARQLAAIHLGQHPLSVALRVSIPLHPQTQRDGDRDAKGPRCGECRFRRTVDAGHARNFPKCLAHPQPRSRRDSTGKVWTWNDYPRISNGSGTDVAAWFPACVDFAPERGTS